MPVAPNAAVSVLTVVVRDRLVAEMDKESDHMPVTVAVAFGAPAAAILDSDDVKTTESASMPTVVEITFPTIIDAFVELGLRSSVLQAIRSDGMQVPSALQQRAIMPILKGRNVMAIAEKGIGKTTAACIAAVQLVDESLDATQVLFLVPTRASAEEAFCIIEYLNRHSHITTHACKPSERPDADQEGLRAGPNIVIATPGRLLQALTLGWLQPQFVKLVVLDQADQLLTSGFNDHLHAITEFLPATARTATFARELSSTERSTLREVCVDPLIIDVPHTSLATDILTQFVVDVQRGEHRFPALIDMLKEFHEHGVSICLVLVNTTAAADAVCSALIDADIRAVALHAGMSAGTRAAVLRDWRNGGLHALVTTDAVCSNIDMQHPPLVVHYDMPTKPMDYLRRVCRSSTSPRKGIAVSLVYDDVWDMVHELEREHGVLLPEMHNDFDRLAQRALEGPRR